MHPKASLRECPRPPPLRRLRASPIEPFHPSAGRRFDLLVMRGTGSQQENTWQQAASLPRGRPYVRGSDHTHISASIDQIQINKGKGGDGKEKRRYGAEMSRARRAARSCCCCHCHGRWPAAAGEDRSAIIASACTAAPARPVSSWYLVIKLFSPSRFSPPTSSCCCCCASTAS
jgi:hypothetical protein